MVKEIVYCDRCKKKCEYIKSTGGYQVKRFNFTVDLCQQCYKDLIKWFEAYKEVNA